ncbi:MAG: antibiotic biosynthesis monooxygenase [Actinomycetota bacterium]|nr:antibiotic biosynthesis monooxygenase [Actinomycetota bacterium]
MAPIAKLVRMHVVEGRRDELIETLEPVRAAAESEPGTEMWTIHADREHPEQVFIYERYCDQAAADSHENLPALKEALGRTASLITGPPEVIHAEILGTAE